MKALNKMKMFGWFLMGAWCGCVGAYALELSWWAFQFTSFACGVILCIADGFDQQRDIGSK